MAEKPTTSRVAVWVSAGCVAVLVGAIITNKIVRQQSRDAYQQDRAAFFANPIVQELVTAGNEKCPAQDDTFLWACGATLRLTHKDPYGYCSSGAAPRYTGILPGSSDRKDPQPVPASWSWVERVNFPLQELRSCSRSETDCAILGLAGSDGSHVEQGVPLNSPDDLPDQPMWPDFEDRLIYGTWQKGAWARYRNSPVFFFFGQAPVRESLKGYRPEISVSTQHPDLPVKISLTLPHKRKEDWARYLGDVFDMLSGSVVNVAPVTSCAEPPVNVRFKLNEFNRTVISDLREWRENRRTSN